MVINEYTFARIFVLAAKPFCILILVNFEFQNEANQLAGFYLVGALSTVLFSFSSYRLLLQRISSYPKRASFYQRLQHLQIFLVFVALFIVSIFGFMVHDLIPAFCVCAALEFGLHELQRHCLYQGQFREYSALLVISFTVTSAIAILASFKIFGPGVYVFILSGLLIAGFLRLGLNNQITSRIQFKALASVILRERSNWLVTGSNRAFQSADRLVFGIFNPSSLWLVTLLSQYFLIFVILYDLFFLGPNKHKILKEKNSLLTKPTLLILFGGLGGKTLSAYIVLMVAIPVVVFFVAPILGFSLSIFEAMVILVFSSIFAVSDKLHEIAHWTNKSGHLTLVYLGSLLLCTPVFYIFRSEDVVASWIVLIFFMTISKFGGLLWTVGHARRKFMDRG